VTLRPVETATLQAVRTAAPATAAAPTPVPTLAEEWWTRTSDQVDPAQAQLVLAALDRYWAVLTPAWRNLDTNHLNEVLTEPRLSQESQIFADQRAQAGEVAASAAGENRAHPPGAGEPAGWPAGGSTTTVASRPRMRMHERP